MRKILSALTTIFVLCFYAVAKKIANEAKFAMGWRKKIRCFVIAISRYGFIIIAQNRIEVIVKDGLAEK